MCDECQFSKVAALGDSAHLHLVVLAVDGEADGAGLDEVHAVGNVTLPDDALAISECPRVKRVRHVHPFVRLFKQRQKKAVKALVVKHCKSIKARF